MPIVFISSWTALKALQAPEAVAFVWAAVLAQATQVCHKLPRSIERLNLAFGYAPTSINARSSVIRVLFLPICVLSFQIWCSDPLVSQRVVSVFCALYVVIMALGVRGTGKIIDDFAPAPEESNVPLDFRRHLLVLFALAAILVIATNETLIALDTTLSTRVVTLSILPMALHCFFWIALQLTHPPLDESDA